MAPDTRCSKSSYSKWEGEIGSLSKDLTQFLKCNEKTAEKFRRLAKCIYDSLRPEDRSDSLKCDGNLDYLIIEDFDDEQIWQELELRNQPMLAASLKSVPKIGSRVELDFGVDLEAEGADDDADEDDNMDEDEGLEEEAEGADGDSTVDDAELAEAETKPAKKSVTWAKMPVRKTIVDDNFFKLGNLEEFLDKEDKREERRLRKQRKGSDSEDGSDQESIDLFADMASDDEGREAKYDDFFDPVEHDVASDDIDDESMDESGRDLPKSQQEKSSEILMKRISAIEDNRLAEKEWQMRGEITSKSRPENSLMEEHLDFDHQTRQTPQITRTLTQKLEDWICQRIKDKAWDDVVRKVKPVEEVFEFRRRLTLDQEKSKVGLAEVYEQEFLKMKEQQKEESNPEHEEIKKLMSGLFRQLDALSNYHFMPRPAQPDLKIVKNLPTIAAEEVIPATVSDATMLAPEEVKNKPKREVIAKDERSKTDKNRERRLKKITQKKKQKFQEEKERKKAERDPRAKERLKRKQALEALKNSTNVKVLKAGGVRKKFSITGENVRINK
ncbi:U3 small nucleolar ribonucleoprotein protein MPP10 [Galendromus occidentalis]|uniref:U3 small nucleolar ribonucleoprotein protein MPP10 n=1 Tax=Galendromus occidentalis TaxID=34638 RepID=A0AAJ7PA54_9ACAR|nr:U3 small nucleolar ribonucleoprotein protein MPP10 [Galendromus occidentalis]